MRKIPTKNYILYFALCLVTILLLLVFINRVKNMEISKKSNLGGLLYEFTEENILLNLNSYALDNPNFFLYISNHNNNDFETYFKDYILQEDLIDSFVYINGWNKLNGSFVSSFKNNLFSENLQNISLNALKQSNIYFFQNGKVTEVLYADKNSINIEDVINFIENFGGDVND